MNRNTAIVLGLVVVVLVVGAYFLWSTNTQAPVAQAPSDQSAQQNPAPTVTSSNPDIAAALVLQDGALDATSPVDSDPTLTQGDDTFVSSVDGSFDVSQF